MSVLRAENVSKRYMRPSGGANHFWAVKGASLEVRPGEVALLTGRSGSGKTTLLHMLSGLLRPTEGRVLLDGADLYTLGDDELSRLRNQRLGVIPQGRSAVDSLTVWENILLPGTMYGGPGREREARRWMDALGIAGIANARPGELSGGELRRMAIARAFSTQSAALLADEPTGDLDDENTARVLEALRDAAKADGRAVLLVSHDAEALEYADAVYRMDGGALSGG